MANQSKRMEEIRQIIRAYLKTKKYKVVARQLAISKNTVRKYIRLVEQVDLPMEDVLLMEDEQLKRLLYSESVNIHSERVEVFNGLVKYWISELRRLGVTRYLLWEEYKEDHPDGFEYSQFCERLGQYIESQKLTIHLSHKPGQRMMGDFAGKKLNWIDRESGEMIPALVWVCVMPFSQYTFAIALDSQQTEDVLHAFNHTLLYYGGSPHAMLSDNFAE